MLILFFLRKKKDEKLHKTLPQVDGQLVIYLSQGGSMYRHVLTIKMLQNHLKGISYPVGDLCQYFTKLTGSSAYILHSNPIPLTEGTNDLL